MTINYTTLLSLAEPTTGTQSGTWGDDVNRGITDYLDIAIAGTQTISGSQTAVTLNLTSGGSGANNIAQVGAGSSGTAQYAIINCTGNPASALTITAPASSRVYVVLNATSTSQSVQIVGAGPTAGVTVVSGEEAVVAWNGSDYIKVASSLVSGLGGLGTGVATALGNNANAAGGFTTPDGVATLTNKRIDPRVSSAASASSVTPDVSSYDIYAYTALAAALTINAPIGTPVNGDKLIFRILDDGTSRALNWNATYTSIGVAIPAATTASKMTYVGCIYNAANTRWDVIAVTTQG